MSCFESRTYFLLISSLSPLTVSPPSKAHTEKGGPQFFHSNPSSPLPYPLLHTAVVVSIPFTINSATHHDDEGNIDTVSLQTPKGTDAIVFTQIATLGGLECNGEHHRSFHGLLRHDASRTFDERIRK